MSDKIVKTDKNIMVEGKSLDSYVNGDTFNVVYLREYVDPDNECETFNAYETIYRNVPIKYLKKFTNKDVLFSFNPHILPIYRGMMSTIYCDLTKQFSIKEINDYNLVEKANTKLAKHKKWLDNLLPEEENDLK